MTTRKLITSRRGFLASLAGAATLTSPAWITRAFAGAMPIDEKVVEIFAAYRAAQQSGRPLLVFVIPEDLALRSERGRLLGALINYGGDDILAAIATVKLACATVKTIRRLGPELPGEPWMVLIETDRLPAVYTTADVHFDVPVGVPLPDDWSGNATSEAEIQDGRRALSTLLSFSPPQLEIRAAQGREAHPAATRELEMALIAGLPSVEQAAAAPARMALGISSLPVGRRAALAQVLADAGRWQYRDERVTGYWAITHGCGGRRLDGGRLVPRSHHALGQS